MGMPCISYATCLQYRPPCAANTSSQNLHKCCVQRPDCDLPAHGGKIAEGYFVHYWANKSGVHRYWNLSKWNWGYNDADFCDEGGHGPTRFIFDTSMQGRPPNTTIHGSNTGGYHLGVYPGNESEWLRSFFA